VKLRKSEDPKKAGNAEGGKSASSEAGSTYSEDGRGAVAEEQQRISTGCLAHFIAGGAREAAWMALAGADGKHVYRYRTGQRRHGRQGRRRCREEAAEEGRGSEGHRRSRYRMKSATGLEQAADDAAGDAKVQEMKSCHRKKRSQFLV
jgi:hypothetical protein